MNKNQLGLVSRVIFKGPRYWPVWRHCFIDGWLGIREAVALYDLARGLPEKNPVIVEIGSWVGKSSVVLGKGVRQKTAPALYCIDPFNAESDAESQLPNVAARMRAPLRTVFERNIRRAGVASTIRILQGMSFEFADKIQVPIDLLFIDGNHSYDSALRDYLDWAPLVRRGGIIAFHDVVVNQEAQGPLRVVMEKLWNNPEWIDHEHVQTLYYARKRH
jgi:predicted O-methyltransferase YrrM